MRDYRQATPHGGYGILLELCRRKKHYWVYTSNIDKHFVRAGYPEERVVECHRSIYEFQCAVPCCDDVWDSGDIVIDFDESTLMAGDDVPRCRQCETVARPCTVLATDDRWLGRGTLLREQNMNDELEKLPLYDSVVILEIGCVGSKCQRCETNRRTWQGDFGLGDTGLFLCGWTPDRNTWGCRARLSLATSLSAQQLYSDSKPCTNEFRKLKLSKPPGGGGGGHSTSQVDRGCRWGGQNLTLS